MPFESSSIRPAGRLKMGSRSGSFTAMGRAMPMVPSAAGRLVVPRHADGQVDRSAQPVDPVAEEGLQQLEVDRAGHLSGQLFAVELALTGDTRRRRW